MKTQHKPTTTSKFDELLTQRTSAEKVKAYCVCCERPLNAKSPPIHHEGKEKKKVPMCARCHWALHYGSLEARKQMKKKIHAWLKKKQK